MTVFACVALWSAYQLAGFGGRYVQTRRLEARLSALHSAEVQAEDAQTAEPAQTPEPTPVETENPTQVPAAEPTAAPAKDAVKSTRVSRDGRQAAGADGDAARTEPRPCGVDID